LAGKSKRERLLGKSENRWKVILKWIFEEVGWGYVLASSGLE
jgi:hypothetical protein